jgi:uncharacterized protein
MEMSIWIFIVVGFLAQMIDGALGMAYGVSSNAFLLSIGIPPAAASASVHAAEVVTTAVSGISHWRFGNIDKKLLLRLMLPGVIGAAIGAYILSSLPGDMLRPYINAYLLVMGLVILRKAFITQPKPIHDIPRLVSPLGFIGGFFDAIGGGGWGPIVTTTLVARGNSPRTTIGSVNASEFFVTLSQSSRLYSDHRSLALEYHPGIIDWRRDRRSLCCIHDPPPAYSPADVHGRGSHQLLKRPQPGFAVQRIINVIIAGRFHS